MTGATMALDKAIEHGKEHRKPYRGSKAFSPSCRDNRCPGCLGNDLYSAMKRLQQADEREKEDETD